MLPFLKTAAGITTMWGLAGLAIVALLQFSKRSGKVHPIAWGVVIGIVVLALVPTWVWFQLQLDTQRATYDLRITVLDSQRMPVNDAHVWLSTGGIPKQVDGGWEFSIPSGSKPADGKLTAYAHLQNASLQGQAQVQLKNDYHPTVTIQLIVNETGQVRGIVQDATGRAVAGAIVSVVGYGSEALTTQADGSFVLAAHAGEGQQVELHTEKQGYRPVNQWCPAGRTPATLVLERK